MCFYNNVFKHSFSNVNSVKEKTNRPIPICHISLPVQFQDYIFRTKESPVDHFILFRPILEYFIAQIKACLYKNLTLGK
jgi:hypothetical protein